MDRTEQDSGNHFDSIYYGISSVASFLSPDSTWPELPAAQPPDLLLPYLSQTEAHPGSLVRPVREPVHSLAIRERERETRPGSRPATPSATAPVTRLAAAPTPREPPAHPDRPGLQPVPQPVVTARLATTTVAPTPLPATTPTGAAPEPRVVAVPLTMEAVVPQPTAPGQVVGLVLQNPTTGTLAARYITLGMTFADGQVAAGQSLVAEIGNSTVPVQMDVKTSYADGSVKMAVLTLQQPAIAADGSVPVMLALGGPAHPATPLDIATLAGSPAYNLTVSLTGITESAYSSLNSTTPSATASIPDVTINVGSLLKQALASGNVSYWLQGPEATQVRIDSGPIAGTPLHLTFDITLYANGATSTDVQFNNDTAMQASLGTQTLALNYNVAITQNGSSVLQQNNITQWQYQTWREQVWSNGAPGVNVQHDIAALEKTGAIQNYDLTTGVDTSVITNNAAKLGGPTYGILGSADVTQFMPMTGGRPDIGPQPLWNAVWLLTQDPSAAAYALAQANAAGSVPWHFYEPATGTSPGSYVTVTRYPALWTAAGGGGNSQSLAQPGATMSQSGWAIDAAHQPDLSYIAYLMTGDRYYLDQLNAQAAYDVIVSYPPARQYGFGNVATNQVRMQAWSLREVVEAAAANPTGSAMQQYFSRIATNTIGYMLQEANTMGAGAVSGWFPGAYGSNDGIIAPWQEDYLATTLGLAAGLGIPGAKELLAWQTNFLAGLFLNGANGFSPSDGVNYNLQLYNRNANGSLPDGIPGVPYTTWSQVTAASQTAGELTNTTLLASSNYQQLAKAALAESITWTGSPQAVQAYGWLTANASLATLPDYQANPSRDIVPRLSDGNLLTNNCVFVRNDTGSTPITVQEGSGDQLVYERGSAPVTIIGGSGINLLFGGSGPTTLIGGPGSDYLFGGSGPTTFAGGSGNDYMQAGSGAAVFDLSPTDVGHDIIAGFKPGTDNLHIAGEAPGSAALASLLAGATQDAGGNAVLHLSASHSVTLQGISASQLTTTLFT